jgi:N-methylhydantoinase A
LDQEMQRARIGVDIGGTFTDVALEVGGQRFTAKVLTTPTAPERGVIESVRVAMQAAKIAPAEVGLVIHGTTLATNALIERKGAKTALLTTEGFRDTVEIRHENRFEQYDINLELPRPLVPRRWRFVAGERVDATGRVLRPLDEAAVAAAAEEMRREGIEAVAVGFLHSFTNPAHERRAGEILARQLPGMAITLSHEVSPEMREYERFSTACANAYVQPLMARYLRRLETELEREGFRCPLYMMLSGGGLSTVDTAARYPVRLVESGPAGGAIFSGQIARQCGLDTVVSFDMGGTTAKICLIEHGRAQTSRMFEVARVYRFRKGSGLPLRIPVIEMVEIGAGGGSIAGLDILRRIQVGPESTGADPGPACYGKGGQLPAVTDADLVLGRIEAARFSGGKIKLDLEAATRAVERAIALPLGLEPAFGALGISEMVDENMSNAARVHAIESGKSVADRTLIAFGGAAPLHAARVAEKLGIRRILVPVGAGVGSAIGFLRAPAAYEIARTSHQRISTFEPAQTNAILQEMRSEAEAIVRKAAPQATLAERRTAYMRYRGQGHEIAVPIPARLYTSADAAVLSEAFEATYRRLYSRIIPGVEIEITSWVLEVYAPALPGPETEIQPAEHVPEPTARRPVLDPAQGGFVEFAIYERDRLRPGARLAGPAVIVEDETSTVVSAAFDATINRFGYIEMTRR